jgi:hypothetical protein
MLVTPVLAVESTTTVQATIPQSTISITAPDIVNLELTKEDGGICQKIGILDVILTNCYPTDAYSVTVSSTNNGFLTNSENVKISTPLKIMVQDDNNFMVDLSGENQFLHSEIGNSHRENELFLLQTLDPALDKSLSGDFTSQITFTATMV